MKGIKHIEISNRFVKFKFDLQRNITVIKGDSATGKTTLYTMVYDFMRQGIKSGVNLSSECPCVALDEPEWQNRLKNTSSSIVFIDEGASFVNTVEFAHLARETDNYFVIITREDLHLLPYSVDEIYEIKTSGKYHTLKRLYERQTITRVFSNRKLGSDSVILTEDSNSGFQFFSSAYGKKCVSANGNSEIFRQIKNLSENDLFVVADGAAFGAETDRVLKTIGNRKNVVLYLPESFEWLILKSGVINGVEEIIETTAEYVDSRKYFTWEQFFTAVLVEKTKDTYLQYGKSRLNENYLSDGIKDKITENIPLLKNNKKSS